MWRLIAAVLCTVVVVSTAHAQTSVVCAHYTEEWSKVSGGKSVAAMNRVIATIPDLCGDLKARAEQRRDDVAASVPATSKPSVASAASQLKAARADPDLKTAFDIADWICKNTTADGFDLEKAYASFPADKLVLGAPTTKPDSDQNYQTTTREAVGPEFKVQYRYQSSVSDPSAPPYGYVVYIDNEQSVSDPTFPSPEAATKWLATFGDIRTTTLGPEVGFGPMNTMLNQNPLYLDVWTGAGYTIGLNWFSPAGLKYIGLMCK